MNNLIVIVEKNIGRITPPISIGLVLFVLLLLPHVWITHAAATAMASIPTPVIFAVGPGYTDVIPHQIVRAGDDRLYIFTAVANQSATIHSYWTPNPGLPVGPSDFQAGPILNEPAVVISVDTVYDGANTIHVLANLSDGTLRDHPFDLTLHSYRPIIMIAPNNTLNNPSSAVSALDIGTSGLSSFFDLSGKLHLLYWSAGDQITYLALSYNPAANSFSQVSGPTRVDTIGNSNNHPVAAISPRDNSLTVAWVSGTNGAGNIYARTRSSSGAWSSPQQVNTSGVWTSPLNGLNIDQGPSLLIDSSGVQHLSYIENWQLTSPFDYGRVHYVRNAGAGWVDQYAGFYSHDPALAMDNLGNLYIIGHGYPLNPTCPSTTLMCVSQRGLDGNWSSQQILASPPSGLSFDSSVSFKWSVVSWNRPESIEFLFFSTPYTSPTLYYGRLGQMLRPTWDVNGDHVADIGDIAQVGLKWQQSGMAGWIPEDVNLDGVIDIGDVAAIGAHWQETW